MLLINEIKLSLNEDESKLKTLVEKKLKCQVYNLEIKKKSLDARKEPLWVYSVICDVDNEKKYLNNKIIHYEKENLQAEYKERNKTVLVVGYGPSGIFSAYRLIEAGYKVIVVEKGKRISEREKDVETFFQTGLFNENSNVQFGEGGAGTFSDAKLTTRIKDKFIDYILDIFIKNGAKKSIAYDHHPHIGTDEIRKIITNITDYLITQGCDFHFDEKVEDFICEKTKILGVKTNKNEIYADYVILASGHSAYDIYLALKKNNIFTEPKDMALGFRVEHPQSLIDARQTNNMLNEASEYLLRYKGEKGVYSFCMCPGGIVIPSNSDKNSIVTNGMSYAARSSGIANSAILIQINKDEFKDGYEYLRNIESRAFKYSNSYKALAQNISDFMDNKLNPLKFESTYPLKTILYNFNEFFNENDLRIIKEALLDFDHKIPGFISDGIMVGPETRSSSPIRITRNEKLESINMQNLYPTGEGAGYGGGIMSCALDGIRVANTIIDN